jgi:hypothetical protein
MGIYLLFGRNGREIGGMFDKGKQGLPGGAYWVGYVRVPSMDAAVATVKAERGTLLNGPMEVPGGDWIAQFSDPHGAFFAVLVNAADTKAARGPEPKAARKAAKETAKKVAKKATTKKKAANKKAAKKKTSRTAAKKKGKKKTPKRGGKKTSKKAAKKKRATAKKAKKSSRRKPRRR